MKTILYEKREEERDGHIHTIVEPVELEAADAAEALDRDPKRWSKEKPKGVAPRKIPKIADVRRRQVEGNRPLQAPINPDELDPSQKHERAGTDPARDAPGPVRDEPMEPEERRKQQDDIKKNKLDIT